VTQKKIGGDLQREREHGKRRFFRNGHFFVSILYFFIFIIIESEKERGL